MEEVLGRRKHFASWMREAEAFRTLLGSGAIAEDERTGQVTLRWDLIAKEHRKVAVSWATEIVEQRRGRTAGGRPRKNSP